MTNKQIAEKIEAAGHQVPAGLNRAKLEALAAEKGVPLEETPAGEGSGTTTQAVGDAAVTLAMIGDLGVTVRPALDGNGFQAVCEQLNDPDLVGFGDTREAAVEDLAEDIAAKREAEALELEDRQKAEALLTAAGHSLDLFLFEKDGDQMGIAVAVNTSLSGVSHSWEGAARELLEELEAAKDDESDTPPQPVTPIHETSPFITPQMASCHYFAGDPTSVEPEKEGKSE